MIKSLHLLLFALILSACKKKIEVIKEVPVEKKTSWLEVKAFTDTRKIILSSGSNTNAIYLQHPFFFTEFRSTDSVNGMTSWGAALPTDVAIKLPIASSFFATPLLVNSSVLLVKSNNAPIASPSGGAYDLKRLDSNATSIKVYFGPLFKCMAINKDNMLLVPYYNKRVDNAFTFWLFSIKVSTSYPYIDTFYTKPIVIPKTRVDGDIRHIAAVDTYFLIDLTDEGIFKVYENGTVKKVFPSRVVDAFYKWNGNVYALVEWGKVLVSSDNAETFQEFDGVNDLMTLSRYTVIKDSLVGANHDVIFTLKWNNTNYATRELKNDGFEGTYINGIEVLHDSVFVATTSGLFVKPLSKFFESK